MTGNNLFYFTLCFFPSIFLTAGDGSKVGGNNHGNFLNPIQDGRGGRPKRPLPVFPLKLLQT